MAPKQERAWPERTDERTRVLVENHDFGNGFAIERALEDEGFEVSICGGPDALPKHRCPLVANGACGLVDGADVVVHSLNPDRPEHRSVLQSLRTLHPSTPLVVEVPVPSQERHAELLEGCTVLSVPATRETLLDAVRAATAGGDESSGSRAEA